MDIKSSDREPFITALQRLRPDLKKTVSELDNHLEVLKNDITDLLGRLQHPRMSQGHGGIEIGTSNRDPQ